MWDRVFICDNCDFVMYEQVPGEFGSETSHWCNNVDWSGLDSPGRLRPEQRQKRLI